MSEKTLIYVDDDEDDRLIMGDALRATNLVDYRLMTFETGVALMDFLQGSDIEPFAFIIDYNMPYLNGGEVIRALRADRRYADVTILIFTTAKDPAVGIDPHVRGVTIVTKPTSFNGIVSFLKEVCYPA